MAICCFKTRSCEQQRFHFPCFLFRLALWALLLVAIIFLAFVADCEAGKKKVNAPMQYASNFYTN